MKNILVFAGTYSQTLTLGTGEVVNGQGEGIYVFRMDPDTGALTRLSSMPGEPNPTYLALDKTKRFLYSSNELKEYSGLASGAVSAYAVDAEKGTLTFLNRRATGGTDACHVAVNDENTYVLVANFMSGSSCVLPLEKDGSLGKPTCFLQHKGSSVDPNRQRGPHAHCFRLDKSNKRALVPDLGADEIVIYDMDWEKGHLIPHGKNPRTKAGEGPRHCVFNPSGKIVYLINEMGSSIYVFSYDEESGDMAELQTISTLPEGFKDHSTCAAIKIHPNGKLLYGSNRGHDSLATYRIDENTGLLTLLSVQSTGGETPRDFDIDPTGQFLIAGNQASDCLVVFRVDQKTGDLMEVFRENNVKTVTGVLIGDMP